MKSQLESLSAKYNQVLELLQTQKSEREKLEIELLKQKIAYEKKITQSHTNRPVDDENIVSSKDETETIRHLQNEVKRMTEVIQSFQNNTRDTLEVPTVERPRSRKSSHDNKTIPVVEEKTLTLSTKLSKSDFENFNN